MGPMIAICAATSLAALPFEGVVTAHSLLGYPVDDKEDVDDLNPTQCEVTKKQAGFLHEVSVIFWDEYILNDHNITEAVLEHVKMIRGAAVCLPPS